MEKFNIECSILIRKPAWEIFRYFIEPSLLSKFWLSSADAPLAVGKAVRWSFMVPGAEAMTTATEIVPSQKISWRWGEASAVSLEFKETKEGTVLHLRQSGFNTSPDSLAEAVESTQGFTIVLCDLKTLLESGKSLNLVKDKAHLIQQS